jgi:hypothetical protein
VAYERTTLFTTYATILLLLHKIEEIAEKLGIKFSDLVTDTDAEPQPVVSGYIEFAGEIVKISSVEDIERVLERLRG